MSNNVPIRENSISIFNSVNNSQALNKDKIHLNIC